MFSSAFSDHPLSVNFERLDDAVRARKALNGRDVLGSDVGAIRIGFAKVPVKNGPDGTNGQEESTNIIVQGVGDLSVGATIHALRAVKGASTIPADQQVLGGAVENYRSNLLLSMIGSGLHASTYMSDGMSKVPLSVTEQQMIMRELTAGSNDAELDIQALGGMVYTIYLLLQSLIYFPQNSALPPCTTRQFHLSLRGSITGAGMPLNYENYVNDWTLEP